MDETIAEYGGVVMLLVLGKIVVSSIAKILEVVTGA